MSINIFNYKESLITTRELNNDDELKHVEKVAEEWLQTAQTLLLDRTLTPDEKEKLHSCRTICWILTKLTEKKAQGERVFVAEDSDRKIQGILTLNTQNPVYASITDVLSNPNNLISHSRQTAVLPIRGTGRALVETSIKIAATNNKEAICANVEPSAKIFYARMGFRQLAEEEEDLPIPMELCTYRMQKLYPQLMSGRKRSRTC